MNSMNQTEMTAREVVGKADKGDINIVELMIVLAKHKKLVIGLPVVVALLSLLISLVLPNTYVASTKLLPPQQAQSSAAALLSQLGGVASVAAGAAGIKNPNDVYIGMLKSRTLADRLIAEYDLKKVYDTDLQEIARNKLAMSSVIVSGKDGLITIEVEDRDRKLVAKLANSYVDQLIALSKTLAVTEASQRRVFYESQLETAKDNLAKAEMSLKGSLDTGGVISVDSESRAIVETVGRLRAQVSAKEIQLNSMRAFVTESNPNYKRTEEELASLRNELSKLENGRESREAAGAGNLKPGGFANIKLLRDVKYYQMLYELLAKQYEAARLDEAKNPSIVQVLDSAVEPERKSKPHRAIIVVLSTLVAFFFSVLWAFVSEARAKVLASAQGAAKWQELKSHLRFK
jgi:tyrosine-protein kinase Etk/Wzc